MSTTLTPLLSSTLTSLKALLQDVTARSCVVGVSGGSDSVFLLRLLHASRRFERIIVAHVNYGLRGNESDGDAVFVRTLAAELGYPCEVLSEHALTGLPPAQATGIEAKAREIRYGFFQQLAAEIGTDTVLVGHTRSDQVETILLNFIRGAGPRGLAGMQAISTQRSDEALPAITIFRPLLGLGKPEIEHDLQAAGIHYRVDSSNYDLDFRRNKLRHEIIPKLLEINPALHETLERTSEVLATEHQDQQLRVNQLLQSETLFRQKSKIEYWLNQSELMKYATSDKRALVLHLLKTLTTDSAEVGYDHVNATLELANNAKPTGRISLPGQTEVEKTTESLILRQSPHVKANKPNNPIPKPRALPCPGSVKWPTGTIQAKRHSEPDSVSAIKRQLLLDQIPPAPTLAYVDADKVGKLTIRTRRAGDQFTPLGLGGSKSLQDFFVDNKLPALERDTYPLILGDKQIVWIPGLAMAEVAKITLETTQIIELEYHPNSAQKEPTWPN